MAQGGTSQASLEERQYRKLVASVQNTLMDQHWRLNNLYRVKDKEGRVVQFRLNDAQEDFYWRMWYLNIILKARQLGFSTFIEILFLDVSLFNPNIKCGIIDITLDDAKSKLDKIAFAYDGLPDEIKQGVFIASKNSFEIVFSNGSSISIGTSHRGGTLQYLHVSELGKIAVKFPERAREIRTGALNTVQAGQFVFIESTAEGQDGDFYDLCQAAEAKERMATDLTPLDFKFNFYPWHRMPEYRIKDHSSVAIPDHMKRYFDELARKEGIKLTPQQKAWYVKKKETQFDDMKREYPATPKEAFEAAIEGAIFGHYMTVAEEYGRIGDFKPYPGIPIHTAWDIGRRDYTSIWFYQVFAGKVRCIHFYQNCLEGMPHYAEYCFGTEHTRKLFPDSFFSKKDIPGIFAERQWQHGIDVFPHDAKVTEWGSNRSRMEQLKQAQFNPKLATNLLLHDGINAARATIGLTEFDEEGCSEGIKVLKLYRWEADELRGGFKTGTERHDVNSHGAAAFRYLSTSWRELPTALEPAKPKPTHQVITTNDDGSVNLHAARARDIIEIRRKLKEMNKR